MIAIQHYIMPRGSGKTVTMLRKSSAENIPILCSLDSKKDLLIQKARDLCLEIPTPISLQDLYAHNESANRVVREYRGRVLIDDYDSVLTDLMQNLYDIVPIAGTMSIEERFTW